MTPTPEAPAGPVEAEQPNDAMSAAPESVMDPDAKKDKKKKKKKDKKMKVKELYDENGNAVEGEEGSEGDDIDSIIQKQKNKLARGDVSDKGSAFGGSQFSALRRDQFEARAGTTIQYPANNSGLDGQRAFANPADGSRPDPSNPYQAGVRAAGMHQTLDVEEDKASVADTTSVGGTRYVIGLKGGLRFYGNQGDDSVSQLSRGMEEPSVLGQTAKGGFRVGTADHNARTIDHRGQVLMDMDRGSVASIGDGPESDFRLGHANDDARSQQPQSKGERKKKKKRRTHEASATHEVTPGAGAPEGTPGDPGAGRQEPSQGGYPDNQSAYSASRMSVGGGNGNPNRLPGLPGEHGPARQKAAAQALERANSVGSASAGGMSYSNFHEKRIGNPNASIESDVVGQRGQGDNRMSDLPLIGKGATPGGEGKRGRHGATPGGPAQTPYK